MTATVMPDPVAAQSKFANSSSWTSCTLEHHQMVLANPGVFQRYETRALYSAAQLEAFAAAKAQVALEALADIAAYYPNSTAADVANRAIAKATGADQ